MNKKPAVAKLGTLCEELIPIMESKGILSIPLIDENGAVVGLETLQNAMSHPEIANPVFIMAGGFGTRLRPLTDNCPKPMLKIGDKPILETVIRSFIKAGFVNFYISTHYMPEQIQDHFGNGEETGDEVDLVTICDGQKDIGITVTFMTITRKI